MLTFGYVGFFSLAYFISPGNSHYCYWDTVECIFSCIYFCEHIIVKKKKKLGADGPAVNFPNVDKGITTFAIHINLNFYIKNIKNRTL